MEKAQRGQTQARCRTGKAEQWDGRHHACGHQHYIQGPRVAAHVAGRAVGNAEEIDSGHRQQPQGFKQHAGLRFHGNLLTHQPVERKAERQPQRNNRQ